jgi:hypothetical protein
MTNSPLKVARAAILLLCLLLHVARLRPAPEPSLRQEAL